GGGAGRDLWNRHDSGENLLLREADFRTPSESKVLRELWLLGGDARHLTGQLVLASIGPLSAVPLLEDVQENGKVRPLTPSEEEQVKGVLRVTLFSVPRISGKSAPSGPLPPLPSPLLDEDTVSDLPAPEPPAPVAARVVPEATILLRSDDDTADLGPA